jgi:hypothetical protein
VRVKLPSSQRTRIRLTAFVVFFECLLALRVSRPQVERVTLALPSP